MKQINGDIKLRLNDEQTSKLVRVDNNFFKDQEDSFFERYKK
jgi:hypothetical protein